MEKNSPDPLGFQEMNLFYVGKEFTLTTTEKVIHLKWKWVFLGIVLQQALQATESRKPCVPNTFRIPMKQRQYKNRVDFSLQNPRRMFSNGKRRRWENAAIYLHCRANRHAVLCQKKNYTDNPACSHLTKRDQSIIPLTSLCYSLHRPHYWNNYLQTQKEPHSGLRWEGIDERNGVRASTWNGFIPIWHPCTWPFSGEFLIYRLSGGAFTIIIWCIRPRLICRA